MTWNRRANKNSGGSWQDENQTNQDWSNWQGTRADSDDRQDWSNWQGTRADSDDRQDWSNWQGTRADSDDRQASAATWGNQSNWKEQQGRSGHGSGYGSHGHGASSWQEEEEDWWNSSKPQADWQNSHETEEEDWWNSSKPQEDWRKSHRSQAPGQRNTGGQQASQDPWADWNGHSRQTGHSRQNGNDWSSNTQDNWKEDSWHGRNERSGQKDPWADGNGHSRQTGHSRQNGNDWSSNTQDSWHGRNERSGQKDPWADWNGHSRQTEHSWQNGNDWSSNTQDNAWSGWNEQSGQNGNDWSNNAQAWPDKWSAVEQWGDVLKEVDWQERPPVTIRKNFYEECAKEAALSRTPEEVEKIRQSQFIEIVEGCSDQHPVPNVINSFDEACFPDELMDSLRERFEEPTPIQKQIWPLAMQGRDVVGIAETGSGKTVAYLLPMICHIFHQEELQPGDGPIALVLAPTRELAKQIQEQCELFGSLKDLKSCTIVGGTPSSEQKEHLQDKNDIVVATPGRFMNALGDGWITLNRATFVVLDEADEMLKKEFYESIRLILLQVRKERQVLMFSATWPEDVRDFAKEICTDSDGMPPVFVRIGGDKLAACKDIEQHTVVVDGDEDKYEKLKERLQSPETFKDGGKAIIFCRTRGAVMRLHEQLEQEDFMWKDGESLVAMLHGEMRQNDRDWAMRQFRQGDLPCVISTGVLARGHDIPKVRFVFNYDVPREAEDYIHRVGRTGRAGHKGYSMIFVDKSNHKELQSSHDFLMGVLQATDQTVEEDFKEAVEYYEQSQNQTYEDYGSGDVWEGWNVEDATQEAADGDAAQEQCPEGTQGTEWQGDTTEGAYDTAEAAGGYATQEQCPDGTQGTEWQEQYGYGQWSEGTEWQEQSQQGPENTQGTLWQAAGGYAAQGAPTEDTPAATEVQAEPQQEQEAAEGDAGQQKVAPTEDTPAATEVQAEPQKEAAEGDAGQQKVAPTEDTPAVTEVQAEPQQEATEGDAGQQKVAPTEDTPAATEVQAEPQQEAAGQDAAQQQEQWQQWEGSQWQGTADAAHEEQWQGYYTPAWQEQQGWTQGGTTEGAYTAQEHYPQWQAHQWSQWQQEQTLTPAVDAVEILSPPFTLGEDDAVKQQNATVRQEGDEGTWWEEGGEHGDENIPETCPVISIDKDPSVEQKEADPPVEQKEETSDDKVTEEDPSVEQKEAAPPVEQKEETSHDKVTEEVENTSTAAPSWQ